MSDEVVRSRKQVIEDELAAIWNSRARLTPADVVEVATAPEHPLHRYFEWNDTAAAAEFRLVQAARLIRSVKVRFTVERPGGEVEDLVVRRYVAPRAAGVSVDVPAGYVPQEMARENPEIRAAILRQMQREMTSLRRRYAHLGEFWRLMDEMMDERPAAAGE